MGNFSCPLFYEMILLKYVSSSVLLDITSSNKLGTNTSNWGFVFSRWVLKYLTYPLINKSSYTGKLNGVFSINYFCASCNVTQSYLINYV